MRKTGNEPILSDVTRQIEAFLRGEGMIAESFTMDGTLCRCGTANDPTSKNGAYIVHLDEPANAWCMDWAAGDEGCKTWCIKPEREMTQREWKAWKQLMEDARKQAEALREAERAEAARKAKMIYAGSADATNETHYLKRKGVRTVAGLKQDRHGHIIMPIMNNDGELVSLQYIQGDPAKKWPFGQRDKSFLKGGELKGCRFIVSAATDCVDETLYVAEGLATALSVHEATKAEVWVALNAGNLGPVVKDARLKFPNRRIVIAADNDAVDKDGTRRPDEKNVGVMMAKAAAMEAGADVAVCPIINDKSTDFNDLHVHLGLAAVRDALGQTLDIVTCPMPSGFHMTDAGLFKEMVDRQGEVTMKRIGEPLDVIGKAKTEDFSRHALVLQWIDSDGTSHRYAMPTSAPHLRDEAWIQTITDGGYGLEYGAKPLLADFLCRVRPIKEMLYVSKTGWHGSSYVLPGETIGTTDAAEAVFQDGLDSSRMYQMAGTFDEWMNAARLAVGNTRMTFALTIPFAGTLLRDAGIDGGGFSLEGGSSCGKTRSMMLAVSVVGNPDPADGQMRSWRATANGLETIAAMANDGVLALDELGQTTGKDLAEALYMIANGGGKTRASRTGGIRRQATWRTMLLSTGELGVAAKLERDGLKSMAGQEVRLVGIRCGREHVVEPHGCRDAAALIGRIEEIIAKNHGHAIRRFLRHYVGNREMYLNSLRDAVDANARKLAGDNAESQVLRVARRFALCIVAGGIARDAGCLPAEMDIEAAVRSCFDDWHADRGDGDLEDTKILKDVRYFIEKYGASRFQDIRAADSRCIDRVGFVEHELHGHDVYYIMPSAFEHDLLAGHDVKRACKVLKTAGWIIEGSDGRPQTRKTLPGMGQRRCYKLMIPIEV